MFDRDQGLVELSQPQQQRRPVGGGERQTAFVAQGLKGFERAVEVAQGRREVAEPRRVDGEPSEGPGLAFAIAGGSVELERSRRKLEAFGVISPQQGGR